MDEQLRFDIPVPDGFDYDFWKQTGAVLAAHDHQEGPAGVDYLLRKLKENRRALGLNIRNRRYRETQWAWGDWLLQGEAGGVKPKQLQEEAVEISGYEWGTLKNFKSIAAKFQESRRRDGLTWSHHVTVSRLHDEMQDKILDRAIERKLSVKDLANVVKYDPYLKDSPPPPKKWLKSFDGVKHLGIKSYHKTLKFECPINSHGILKELAEAKGFERPIEAMWWMVTEYWKQNEAALRAEIADFKEDRKKRVVEAHKPARDPSQPPPFPAIGEAGDRPPSNGEYQALTAHFRWLIGYLLPKAGAAVAKDASRLLSTYLNKALGPNNIKQAPLVKWVAVLSRLEKTDSPELAKLLSLNAEEVAPASTQK